MHVSVTPCLTEVIVRGKILLVRVLENQQTSLAQQSVRKNKVDCLLRTFEIVRSIRKNYIELLAAALQIEKDIRLDGIEILESERSGSLPDKIMVHGIYLDRRYAARLARGKFVADRPRARKQIEHVALGVVDHIVQYIEQILLREIRRRPRTEILRRVDSPSLVFTAYYSHEACLNIVLHISINPPDWPTMRHSVLYIWYSLSIVDNR